MLSLLWIYAYIIPTSAFFSNQDEEMPSCSNEKWRHQCQNRKYFADYNCIRTKFGSSWKNKLPHTKELIEEVKARQKMIEEGSIQNMNDRVDAKIVARIVSDPLKFWTRIIKREVQPNEVPANYLGSHALEYRDEDMLKIVSAFFPIMHLTPHTGGLVGNLAAFKNTNGCDEQEDLYLLQNKRDFLNTFEVGSEKQAMVDYSALLQFINA